MIILDDFSKEMPIGFVMSLVQSENALKAYASLDVSKKENIKNYIINSINGNDAKMRIEKVITDLENNII